MYLTDVGYSSGISDAVFPQMHACTTGTLDCMHVPPLTVYGMPGLHCIVIAAYLMLNGAEDLAHAVQHLQWCGLLKASRLSLSLEGTALY